MMNEHPSNLSECVKKDVYDRDLQETKKCIEELKNKLKEQRIEIQKEIDYKNNTMRYLVTGGLSVALGINAYLFTQINEIRNIITDHIQILGHMGMDQRVANVEEMVTSIMCKVFGSLC
jgi:phenylalanyl-tRNA synthetase alpha subunit